MSKDTPHPGTEQAKRTVHRLTANEAVVHVSPEQYLRMAEADANHYAALATRLKEQLAALPRADPKPRRKSMRVLIALAKEAGLTVTGLRPDGSIETATVDQHPQEGRQEADQEANPWHQA